MPSVRAGECCDWRPPPDSLIAVRIPKTLQPSIGMVSRDHYGHRGSPFSGGRQEGFTISLCSPSLSAIRARAGPRGVSDTFTNAGRVSPKSPLGNRVPAARSRHCRKRRLEISAAQSRPREKPGVRQADAPYSQRRMRPNRCASSSKWRTDDGCHFRPPRAGRSPI